MVSNVGTDCKAFSGEVVASAVVAHSGGMKAGARGSGVGVGEAVAVGVGKGVAVGGKTICVT